MSANADVTTRGVSLELQHDIEQFLYAEADLLDDRRVDEWFDLLTDDIHYWMPVRANRLIRELDQEYSSLGEAAYFDENKFHMKQRVERLHTGMAWAEDPPSRTRHYVTNVRIKPLETEGEFEVSTNFILYRTRLEREVDLFAGKRIDVLRRSDNAYGWMIAKRTILLDQSTLLAKNLSSFF